MGTGRHGHTTGQPSSFKSRPESKISESVRKSVFTLLFPDLKPLGTILFSVRITPKPVGPKGKLRHQPHRTYLLPACPMLPNVPSPPPTNRTLTPSVRKRLPAQAGRGPTRPPSSHGWHPAVSMCPPSILGLHGTPCQSQ